MDLEQRAEVIYEIVRRALEQGHDVGRTKIQKLIYFFQETGPNLGYRYQLYHYGPYSHELSNDLNVLSNLDILRVQPDPAGYGFHIHDGKPPQGLSPESVKKYNSSINRLIRDFASLHIHSLEIMGTIKFVRDTLERRNRRANKAELLDTVKKLKPAFSSRAIQENYERLNQLFRSSRP